MTKPMVFEKMASIVSGLGALELYDFDQVGYWIDTCECIKAYFLFIDFDVPGANEIDIDFKPR